MKKRILFIIYSLDKGGAEKNFSLIANHLNKDKFEIHFLTIYNTKKDKYLLDSHIFYQSIYAKRTLFSFLKVYSTIKKIEPVTVVVTIAPVILTVALIRRIFGYNNIKFIMRETAIPSINNKYSSKSTFILNYLCRLLYKVYDLAIVQGVDMQDDLVTNFNFPINNTIIINNPISIKGDKFQYTPQVVSKKLTLITVGNLRKEKGHLRILDILYKLKNKISFEYWIVGDGRMLEPIKEKVLKLDLSEFVVFKGNQENVIPFLQSANIFIQGSYYEGFPNAILEAAYVGIPTIAYDVKGGTKEIIINNFNGYLVRDNDIEQFVQKILEFSTLQYDSFRISTDVQKRFGLKNVLDIYESIL
jgi:glycosyltransferase involved in cell wall biosynthesis